MLPSCLISLALAGLACSAPLPQVPDPAATLAGFSVTLNQFAAMFLNTATGLEVAQATNHATLLLGEERVQAIDNIGDDACIAQFDPDQGQVCGEAAAFAAGLIYAAEQGFEMGPFAAAIGPDRIAQLNSVLTTLCVGPESTDNTCSVLLANADLFANAALDVPDPGGHSNPYTLSEAGVLTLIDNAGAVVTGQGADPGPF